MMKRKLITAHEYPPIPRRDFDWCAYWDGEEETGHYGWGATEAEAVADLRRLDEEREEAEQEAEWREHPEADDWPPGREPF